MSDNQRLIFAIIVMIISAVIAYYMREMGLIRAYYQFWGVVP